jgi:D-cysteine desulfhydrase
MGWVREPTPVEAWAEAARVLGFASLWIKRDDQIPALGGGTKVRKLDYLLAHPRLADAARMASLGAIGSGHLVALSAAARLLGRELRAHVFWEPVEAQVMANLAATASGSAELRYHPSRLHLALAAPSLLLADHSAGHAVVPAGGTCGRATVGIVQGALELAAQVRAGDCPAPDVLVVPYGSGGTAAGLALGLGLAGLETEVFAVATVESWYATSWRLQSQIRAAAKELGFDGPLPRPRVVSGYVGDAYGVASAGSRGAVDWAAHLPVEPIYTGKALHALRELPQLKARHVLFWQTSRAPTLPPPVEGWEERLPDALRRRLAGQGGASRRRLLAGLGALAVVGGFRVTGYTAPDGVVLAGWELEVVAAAARVLVPASPLSPDEVASNVDRYLQGMPGPLLREVHGLMVLLEQGGLRRLTHLADAEARLVRLKALPMGSLAWRGIRDLCLLGYWQDPRTWSQCGFDGPRLPSSPRTYAELRA